MNKLFFILLLIPTATFSKITEETCREIVKHSKLVLQYKQSGLPIDAMLEKNDVWFKDASKAQKDYANITIQLAYSLPSYTNQKANELQLNNFMASQYLNCKKAMR